MELTLYYRGDLKANRGPGDKHRLRRHFHPQLKQLWSQPGLSEAHDLLATDPKPGATSIIQQIGSFAFAPLVCRKLRLIAEISVILLRPEQHGSIITKGGDLDNRLKTLLDALRMPSEPKELPVGITPTINEVPFFCLLEDDKLVTKVTVEAHQLLEPAVKSTEVVLLINVRTRVVSATWDNIGFG